MTPLLTFIPEFSANVLLGRIPIENRTKSVLIIFPLFNFTEDTLS